MPYKPIPREVVRSTLCSSGWPVDVKLMCSDRIPLGQPAFLYLGVAWPQAGQQLTLTFRKSTGSASGDIRFDGQNGPNSKQISGDISQLLTIYGQSATAGQQADVALDVQAGDKVRTAFTLSVGSVTTNVDIHAENGVDPPPNFILPETSARFKAVANPSTPGTFLWLSVAPAALEIKSSTQNELLEVVTHLAQVASRALCVLFTPQQAGAAAVMNVLSYSSFFGRVEDRSVAPTFSDAGATHIFLASKAFTIVDSGGNPVVTGGTLDANGRFDVALQPQAGQHYELKTPNYDGLAP